MPGNEFHILAPGPSMSQELADSLKGRSVGVVGNCFALAPWADFLAANDRAWWDTYPEATEFAGRKFSANKIHGIEQVPKSSGSWNSGLLAVHVAAMFFGATMVRLHGFDMHGTHFFGPYTNGLRNTIPYRRKIHQQQFRLWAMIYKDVKVLNCTPGSALSCFPREEWAP